MAQQITIDIVAETKKLASGIDDANKQIDGMSGKLKGIASAAGIAATGFLAKEGLTFLKQGIDEAKDAREAMNNATTAFGAGSETLKKITEDADKFGKALAIDNDDIIKLATSLGSRLPEDAKSLSAELVNTAKDIEAVTSGALTAEAVTSKLAKAFADGEVSAKELRKIFPDLTDATYDQAEALSKAGDNQGALSLVIDAAQEKYGDAAEKNVTSTQKFETALADLKEQVGTTILPIVEKFVGGIVKLLDAFNELPGPVKNIIIVLGLLLTTGALTLTFLASMKTSMITLGIVNGTTAGSISLVTIATNLLKIAMAGLGIGLLIAAIVLLVQNWDTVVEVAKKVKDAIFEFFGKAFEFVKEAIGKAVSWVKENWPLIIAILTGPIGLAIKYIVDNFDKIKDKAGDIIENIKDIFSNLPSKMLSIGKDIVSGIWNGMKSMAGWLKDKVFDFFGNLIPGWAKKVLGIGSPSKVFARYGRFIVEGLAVGIERSANIAKAATQGLGLDTIGAFGNIATPQLATASPKATPINITVNAGLGTDPYELGRVVDSALKKYGSVSGRF